jgi:hypothetical protein
VRGWVPRARRELARGAIKPSSEAGVSWCDACSSSETEFCPRGAEASYLMGREAFFDLGCSHAGRDL